MQVDDLIPSFVTHDDKQRTLLLLDTVLDQSPDSTVDFLPHNALLQTLHLCSVSRRRGTNTAE